MCYHLMTSEEKRKYNRKKDMKRRADPAYRAKKNRKKVERRKRNEAYKESHAQRMVIARQCIQTVSKYEEAIQKGHDQVCFCCGQLFAEIGMVRATQKIQDNLRQRPELSEVEHWAQVENLKFCHTCNNSLAKGKMPKLWLGNGLAFPDIPDELKDLSPLEQRLVSARIPFMQLRELRPTTQLGIRGNIVNVPVNIEQAVDVLPRKFDKTSVVQLAFKRRLRYKGCYLKEWVHPHKVYQAAKFLVEQPVYQEEGIKLDLSFLQEYPKDNEEFVVEPEDDKERDEVNQEEDEWNEAKDDEPLNLEDEQTMLKEAIPFAPGEGHTPMSILADERVEELSFPAIYCGQKRQPKVKLSYHDIARSEIRRYDRRCCDPVKIFFMFRKREMLALSNAISIYLKLTAKDLNREQALNRDYVESLIRNDEAYRFLGNDRTSPVYWAQKKKELMATIKTLGLPTFFLTLSAAETRWPELIKILVKVLEHRDITDQEVAEVSWERKCYLIRKDPVTCARYFDRRVRELFKLIRSESGVFGEYRVGDYYIRIEFQFRGSPHVHCLIWILEAPKYDKDLPESKVLCEEFIDRFITCQTDKEDMEELYKLQFHKHTSSCKRMLKDETICRFGVPYFPMPATKILEPLGDEELTDEELEEFPSLLAKIKQKLSVIAELLKRNRKDVVLNFEEFLSVIGITYEQYERVIRNTLRRSKVFLKREPKDIRTNAFNEEILRRHRANMDLQFVLDPYACVHYILDYINKSNRGMSRLLKEVVEDLKAGNMSHRQKLYKIASKFINASEVSAQEAVYILLGMPLSISSRASVFINTGEKSERVRRLKAEKELQELEPDSRNVLMDGLIDYYMARPDDLEDVCLADFAANYDKVRASIPEIPDENQETIEKEDTSGKIYKLQEGKGTIRERKIPKVIRYRKYQKEKEPLNFFREKLMLFIPFRDEDAELIEVDVEAKFKEHLTKILEKEREYNYDLDLDYQKLETELEKEAREEFLDDNEVSEPNEYAHLGLRTNDVNFEEELCDVTGNNPSPGTFLVPKQMEDTSYSFIINQLNYEQRHFVYGLVNHVKTTEDPFLVFLTGGAGVGKSVTILAVYQSLTRWYARQPDCQSAPDLATVLLVGPTGKSAFHIGGTTIHSAFGIPVAQNKAELKPMSPELKNKFRNRLWNLKVIIMDEVSMVGSGTLKNVHNRLVEIFEVDKPFAGKSVLFVGDLNQLKPVMDSYIFMPRSGYDLDVIAGNILWEKVMFYRLNIIMRQRDDLKFAQALNNLAAGQLTEEDKSLFQSRLFPKTSLLLPSGAIRLFSRNESVGRYNEKIVADENGQTVHRVEAKDTCNHSNRTVRERAIFSISLLKAQQTYGLHKSIDLKVGVRYMVSINVDIEDGLVNGSAGLLREVDTVENDGQTIVIRCWIEFDSTNIGWKARSTLPKRFADGKGLTPVTRVKREIPTKTGNTLVRVMRCQFPLVVCEAITIHKSQGQTYDQVIVDVSSTSEQALLYTAFSRARTSSGLFLQGPEIRWPKPRPALHPVSRELARLEADAKWEIPLALIQAIPNRELLLVIGYQNLPWLIRHSAVVTSDHNLSACDLLCFVETRASNVPLEGFQLLAEVPHDQDTFTPPHGVAIYSRNPNLKGTIISSGAVKIADKYYFEFIWLWFEVGFSLTVVYVPPKATTFAKLAAIRELVEKISQYGKPAILMGDFNVQLQSTDGHKMEDVLKEFSFTLTVPRDRYSTDYRTQIDLVFANFQVASSYYESVFSDHKPVLTVVSTNQAGV